MEEKNKMIKKLDIYQRVIDEANYIVVNKSTIRGVAQNFGVAKTTVHNDLRLRLPQYDPILDVKVDAVLVENNELKHVRGGESTRRRYQKILKK